MTLTLALLLAATPLDYDAVKSDLATLRARAAVEHAKARTKKSKAAVLDATRVRLLAAYDERLFPAWAGTKWEFYGTSETPGEGAIACGYYVSTLLRDAGFKVERVKLAQQASERIVLTLCDREEILRFRGVDRPAVIEAVRAKLGDGLFVVGMDYHVAYLRLSPGKAQLCHSAVFEPTAVVCEDAATSPGFASAYYVVGRLFSDALLRAWLKGEEIPTR